jgi:putative SOS response-associated peptidase YedK
MCGRIAAYSEPSRVARELGAILDTGAAERWEPHWNLGPTSLILAASEQLPDDRDERVLRLWEWGFVPPKGPTRRVFNARAESIASNGLFAPSLRSCRLLVPVDGFYEWTQGANRKQPHYFTRRDGAPLVFAGLGRVWHPPAGAPGVLTVTIITTAATADLAGIHDRQPVVLEPGAWDRWLDPTFHDTDALAAMTHTSAGVLVHRPVDPRVGSVRNDEPGLLAPH